MLNDIRVFVQRVAIKIRALRGERHDAFLRDSSGVIHVGANTGQERDIYASYGLDVVWIEPIAEVFQILQRNLEPYPRQRAYQYLIADVDGKHVDFHVANNEGASSSMFGLHHHKDLWPDVAYERTLSLQSTTLASFVEKEHIDMAQYDTLVMDTQGSELLVLEGAGDLVQHVRFIKTEASDFDAYKGGCQIEDLTRFLEARGFRERSRRMFAIHREHGAYYDVIYEREHG